MSGEHLAFSQQFPGRATRWRLRTRTLDLPRRPLLMGIVNVTPDSFSDGGLFADPSAAIDHALGLVEQGADLLDIGGESTRPYSEPVSADEELLRVEHVVREVCRQVSVPVSIDTSKARVAEAALAAGAEIVNDITALAGDPAMVEVIRNSGAGVCVMHMQGTPQTMQDDPRYDDVVAEIGEFLRGRRDWLIDQGIAAERICLDPGIGFGKTNQHNLTMMAHCDAYHALGCPLLVGHSRKRFLTKLLGGDEALRDAGTIGAAIALANQGVQIVRVHAVDQVRAALRLYEAAGGLDGREATIE
ncbi:MAG: dihydropteroate synthase [Pirellulales bacterium]